MKKMIFLFFWIILSINSFAQFNPQDTLQLQSLDEFCKISEAKEPTYFKTAGIVFGTFLINETIIYHDLQQGNFQYTSEKVGSVYAIGVTISITVFLFEYKKHKKLKL